MFTSIILAGLLAGDPVPVLRFHGKPATKKTLTTLPRKRLPVDPASVIAEPADVKTNPAAFDHFPEGLGASLYGVKDAKGKFAFEVGDKDKKTYFWEGVVPVHDTDTGKVASCHLCVDLRFSHGQWWEPTIELTVRSTDAVQYNRGNFVFLVNGAEESRDAMNPIRTTFNNDTLLITSLIASFGKMSWMIRDNQYELRFGNLIIELPEESLAAIRLMARSSLDFAENREEQGRQRLDEQIRLQEIPPSLPDSPTERQAVLPFADTSQATRP